MSISSSHSKEMVMLWETFKYELIYENRFFLANPIINIIESIVKRTRIELIDQCLFRAREYLEDEYDYGYNYEKPRKILFESSEHINNGEIDKVDERYLYELFILGVVNGKDAKTLADKYSMGNSKFADMISKRIKSKEWGFGERESGRPPYSKAGINRANTKYIPFMYLADTLETALLEIDATTWKKYSVAKYRISDILYLADFSVEKFKLIAAELSDDEKTICDYVREAFSYPASSVDRDYIVSQYIAGYVKSLKMSEVSEEPLFDGIMYDSSKSNGGKNYTLFNDGKCVFVGSELHGVSNISVETIQFLPQARSEDT